MSKPFTIFKESRSCSSVHSATLSKHRKGMPILFSKSRSSKKKERSLRLNQEDFEFCQAPDENDMNGLSSQTNPSETHVSEETLAAHSTSPTSPRNSGHSNDFLHHIRNRLRPHRYEPNHSHDNSQDRNQGYVLVEGNTSQLVFISTDHLDQQMTQHGIDCFHGQLEEETNGYPSDTPVTPNLIPPSNTSILTAAAINTAVDINDSHPQLDIQATRAPIECVASTSELDKIDEADVSATNSSSSTNSSNADEYLTNVDLSTLTDDKYIERQKRALERLTIFENEQLEELHDLKDDLHDVDSEFDVDTMYNGVLARHRALEMELRQLKERRDLACSRWICEICTFENDPCIVTGRNVCQVCEGPSPLKRHVLTS